MKVVFARFAIGEQHLFGVVVHVGIADRSSLGIQEHADLAGAHVQRAELPHVRASTARVSLVVFVIAEVADVGVPVRILILHAHGEHDFLDGTQRAGQRLCQDRRFLCGKVRRHAECAAEHDTA